MRHQQVDKSPGVSQAPTSEASVRTPEHSPELNSSEVKAPFSEESFTRVECAARFNREGWVSRKVSHLLSQGPGEATLLQDELRRAFAESGSRTVSIYENGRAVKLTVENSPGNLRILIPHLFNGKEKNARGVHSHLQGVLTGLSTALGEHVSRTKETLQVEVVAQQVINSKLGTLLKRIGFQITENAPPSTGRTILNAAALLTTGYAFFSGFIEGIVTAATMFSILSSTKGQDYALRFEISPKDVNRI